MPARLSLKLVLLVAAVAFVAAFRLHAGGDDSSPGATTAATTLSPARASALRSDTAQPVSKPVHARLGSAPGLPALHRGPARPHRAAPHRSPSPAVAVAAPAATPVATPVPTAAPVVTAPRVAPARPSPKYVGKSFDSKG